MQSLKQRNSEKPSTEDNPTYSKLRCSYEAKRNELIIKEEALDICAEDDCHSVGYDSICQSTWDSEQEQQEDRSAINETVVDIGATFTTKNRNRQNKGSRKMKEDRKLARNSGQAYVTAKGKQKMSKEMKPLHTCRMQCQNKLPEDIRTAIFTDYWGAANYNRRVAFVTDNIEIRNTATSRKRDVSEETRKIRLISTTYYLEVNGVKTEVCKGCFMATLGETKAFIDYAIEKKRASKSGIVDPDGRGKDPPKNKISAELIGFAKDHIRKFPVDESQHSTKKYLQPHLNLTIMYNLYRQEKRISFISKTLYSKIFHSLNLSFKNPKKDFVKMEFKLEKDINVQQKFDDHIAAADRSYVSKTG